MVRRCSTLLVLAAIAIPATLGHGLHLLQGSDHCCSHHSCAAHGKYDAHSQADAKTKSGDCTICQFLTMAQQPPVASERCEFAQRFDFELTLFDDDVVRPSWYSSHDARGPPANV